MIKIVHIFERVLIWGILLALLVILLLSFFDITLEIADEIRQNPSLTLNANDLMDLFSMVLIILIGLELLETVKMYLKEDVVHVELVLMVAMIALARKVIVWDFNKYSSQQLLSIAAIIVSLGVTYYLIKRADMKLPLLGTKKPKGNDPEK